MLRSLLSFADFRGGKRQIQALTIAVLQETEPSWFGHVEQEGGAAREGHGKILIRKGKYQKNLGNKNEETTKTCENLLTKANDIFKSRA